MQPDYNMPAVILGTELPRSIALIRSLGKAGIPVVAVDHRERMPGAFSRYITHRYIERHVSRGTTEKIGSNSDWFFSIDQALERLLEIGKAHGGVLIPTNDDYSMLVGKYHDELGEWFTPSIPPWPLIEPLFNKIHGFDLARSAGVAVPESFVPETVAEGERLIETLDLDQSAYIFKLNPWASGPCDPDSGAMTRPAGGDVLTALGRFRETAARVEPPIIQEVVPGDASVCVGVTLLMGQDGEVAGAYACRRLLLQTYAFGGDQRHPYELGANIYAESCHDPEAIEAAISIMKRTDHYGIATVEFRRRRSDNKLFFIKIDPRVVNGTALARAIGIDIPLGLYQQFSGEQMTLGGDYKAGVGWIWGDRWLRTVLGNRAQIPLRNQFVGLLRRLGSIRSTAYFDWRDPKPWLRSWQMECKWQIARWRKRCDSSS